MSSRPFHVHTPKGPRLVGSRPALAAVARKDEARYEKSTTDPRGQTDGGPEAGGNGVGTSLPPASLVAQLAFPGTTICAWAPCSLPFVQPSTGRKRRTCSDKCRKRMFREARERLHLARSERDE